MKAKNLYLAAIYIFLPAMLMSMSAESLAQPGRDYPKNYFRWPLNLKPAIVANFGELRPNHWHMGLDIRTNQKENQPVYAAASGYIAKIRIERSGFGQCIWINHPNGLTTLYAHLNSFFPALGKYITEQQYTKETWAIELDFPKEKFPVTKGQLIAYSGNTGGSQGPHLHFEIRDIKTDECLNPLLFGMPLQDNVPPTLLKLALYDRSGSIYEEVTDFFPLKKTDSGYTVLKSPLIKIGLNKLSFALQAFDRMSGSMNEDGIFSAQLFFDKKPVITFAFDSVSYRETKYLNAHVDYKYRFNGGAFFQHLSKLPGNRSNVYYPSPADGVIVLDDTTAHSIRIEVRDAYQNVSVLKFSIQRSDEITRPAKTQSTAKQFVPNYVNVLEKPDFEAYLTETCLYDTLRSYYSRGSNTPESGVSGAHQLNDPSVPVHDELTIRIKPDKPVPDESKERILIQRSYRNEKTVRKASWQGDWLSAKFGDFGVYQAFSDMEPPTINDPGGRREGRSDTFDLSSAKRIVFQPGDNFGGIRSFRAELDGHWLRFTNDKGWAYIYIFDEHCSYGIHQLKVAISDIAGNETIKTWWIKRYSYHPGKKVSTKKSATRKAASPKKPAPSTKPVKKSR